MQFPIQVVVKVDLGLLVNNMEDIPTLKPSVCTKCGSKSDIVHIFKLKCGKYIQLCDSCMIKFTGTTLSKINKTSVINFLTDA